MTATISSSLEVFGEEVCRMVEDIGADFTEPDDDWTAVLKFRLRKAREL